MLFACGSDESEHARLGSAMSCSGGMDLVEDAEESDFCEGMVRVTEEGRRARVTRSAGRAVGLQGTRQRRG